MKALSVFALALLATGVSAFASVTVSNPTNGATVPTTFLLNATASPCSSQPISAMGYSFDTSTNTAVAYSSALNAYVTAPAGTHVLHVKSWGNQGAACVTDVSLTVVLSLSNVTVTAPLNGASVTSPFAVAASGAYCEGQPISAMGYSLDNSTSTTILQGTVLSGSVTAASGQHTLHVKSWGPNGAACVTNLSVDVTAPAAPAPAPPVLSGPIVPATATVVKAIQALTTWKASYDTGTSGNASGVTSIVPTPSISGQARQFVTNYTNYGGERYSDSFGADSSAENFVYDAWVYLASPISDISNIEMDMNQVMSNGQTVIYAFQCAGWSKTWDYTENAGTPTNPVVKWMHSNQTCNPQAWAANTWHHVQISYSRDSSGNVTYQSVWLDGVEQDINQTVPSAFALGWGPALVTNFQIDGFTSTAGSATVYLDNLTVSRW
ncbi:MAG: hypothetical protein ACLGSD_04985 [Acidobacteriota bacterium]